MTDTDKHNTAPTDLIQLPDGNWIDPARVIGLEYRPFATGPGYPEGGAKDRVIIRFPEGADMVRFSDAIEAVEFRDDLARKVNAARAATRRQGALPAPSQGESFSRLYERVMRMRNPGGAV